MTDDEPADVQFLPSSSIRAGEEPRHEDEMPTPSAGTRSVVVERDVPFAPEKIWRALTQPHLIEEWLMKNDFRPVVGHRFNLEREPVPEMKVVVDCEVIEVEPNRTLSYTWSAYGLDSVVTWTLTPSDKGTFLRMEQSGFPADQKAALKGATASWPHFIDALEELLGKLDKNSGE